MFKTYSQNFDKKFTVQKNPYFIIVTIILFYHLLSPSLIACRFTVREIGFADFGIDTYHLYLFKDKNIDENQVSTFKRISFAALLDANIKPDVIDVRAGQDSLSLFYYENREKKDAPCVALVAPDRKVKYIYLSQNKQDFKESVWLLMEKVVSSPIRDQILKRIVPDYGIVLLIEGNDSLQNQKAIEAVNAAIQEISLNMANMPKPVENPPSLIILKQEQVKEEEILLWSLGWSEEKIQEPAVAMLYGRGRLMGELLQGEHLNETVIRNLLTFIGADCECGLDRSWILGSMIPLRWDSERQTEIVSVHNFDAENPMIKAEMSQILSISPAKVREQQFGNFFGYSEQEIELVQKSSANQELESQRSSILSKIWLWIAITFVLVFITGIIIYIKRRSVKSSRNHFIKN